MYCTIVTNHKRLRLLNERLSALDYTVKNKGLGQ